MKSYKAYKSVKQQRYEDEIAERRLAEQRELHRAEVAELNRQLKQERYARRRDTAILQSQHSQVIRDIPGQIIHYTGQLQVNASQQIATNQSISFNDQWQSYVDRYYRTGLIAGGSFMGEYTWQKDMPKKKKKSHLPDWF